MDGGFVMSFLDDSTLLFGDATSIRVALDTRDGQILGLDTNGKMADMMTSVDSAPVWSILDQQGTQNALHSAMGDASKIADYDTIKKRLLGSRYAMNFNSGVNFDMTVVTSDSTTACYRLFPAQRLHALQESECHSGREGCGGEYVGRLRRIKRASALQSQRPAIPVADALGIVRGCDALRTPSPSCKERHRN